MPAVTYNGYLQSITFIFILSDDSAEIIFVQLKKAEFMRSTFKVLFYLKHGTDIPGRDEKTVRNISCGFFCPGQGIAECVDNQ